MCILGTLCAAVLPVLSYIFVSMLLMISASNQTKCWDEMLGFGLAQLQLFSSFGLGIAGVACRRQGIN